MRRKINNMKKLRFLGTTCARETYIKDTKNDDTRMALMIRLNMVDVIGTNFGVKSLCEVCKEVETTEHIITCHGDENMHMDQLIEGTRMKKVVDVLRILEKRRRDTMIEDILNKIKNN